MPLNQSREAEKETDLNRAWYVSIYIIHVPLTERNGERFFCEKEQV